MTCQFPACTRRDVVAHGLCTAHAQQRARHGADGLRPLREPKEMLPGIRVTKAVAKKLRAHAKARRVSVYELSAEILTLGVLSLNST